MSPVRLRLLSLYAARRRKQGRTSRCKFRRASHCSTGPSVFENTTCSCTCKKSRRAAQGPAIRLMNAPLHCKLLEVCSSMQTALARLCSFLPCRSPGGWSIWTGKAVARGFEHVKKSYDRSCPPLKQRERSERDARKLKSPQLHGPKACIKVRHSSADERIRGGSPCTQSTR